MESNTAAREYQTIPTSPNYFQDCLVEIIYCDKSKFLRLDNNFNVLIRKPNSNLWFKVKSSTPDIALPAIAKLLHNKIAYLNYGKQTIKPYRQKLKNTPPTNPNQLQLF